MVQKYRPFVYWKHACDDHIDEVTKYIIYAKFTFQLCKIRIDLQLVA